MGKIGDLWVRLGLKKEGFDKGVGEANKSMQGFGKSMTAMKAVGAAVWGFIANQAFKAAESFAHTSQRFGDIWDSTTSQMKAAWNTFTTALTNWNWEGFSQRITNAMKGAKEAFSATDAQFEVMNAIELEKSAISDELEALKTRTRNQKLSYKEREAAAKEYLDRVKVFYDEEQKLRERQASAQTSAYLGKAGISDTQTNRDALFTFLTQVAKNEPLLNALDQYSKRNRGARNYKLTQQDLDLVDAFLDRYGNVGFYATMAESYKGMSDDETKAVKDAITAANYAKSAYNAENQRMMTMLNSLGASSASGGDDSAAKKAAELKAAADKVRDSWQTLEGVGNPLDKVAAAVTDSANDIKDALTDVVSASQKATILANNGWHGTFEGWQEYLQNMAETMRSASDQIRQAIVYGFSDSFALLADGITGVEKIDAGKAFGALVKPMADAVTSIGEMISMTGLAEIAFKKSFTNPYAAVAAGAALIAVGQLASSGIQKALGGGAAAAASSTSGTSSFGDNVDYSGELTIYVKGEIKGDTIAISGQKAVNSWNR